MRLWELLSHFFAATDCLLKPIFLSTANMCPCSMFCVMQINSIPAVYLTARVAACSIMFLYLAVIFCFPAYCYLDMKRQAAGRRDVCVWKKCENQANKEDSHYLEKLLYNHCYRPLILGESYIRVVFHSLIWACAALLLGLGLYGISVSTVGLGLQVRSIHKILGIRAIDTNVVGVYQTTTISSFIT